MSLPEISGRHPTDVLNARVALAYVSKQTSVAICEIGRFDELRSLVLIASYGPGGPFGVDLLDLYGPSFTDQSNGNAGRERR